MPVPDATNRTGPRACSAADGEETERPFHGQRAAGRQAPQLAGDGAAGHLLDQDLQVGVSGAGVHGVLPRLDVAGRAHGDVLPGSEPHLPALDAQHVRARRKVAAGDQLMVRHDGGLRYRWSATLSTLRSAGVTPATRDAWPMLTGRMRSSVSAASADNARTAAKSNASGIRTASCFAWRAMSLSSRWM